jgi:twitching motility protein PilT
MAKIVDPMELLLQKVVSRGASDLHLSATHQPLVRIDGELMPLESSASVRNLIREGKTQQISNLMTTNKADGMQTIEMALKELAAQGKISQDQVSQFLKTNQ